MTVIAAAVPHHEGPGCLYSGGSMHCYTHMVDEVAHGAYRVCGECFHVFQTTVELLEATAERDAEMFASLGRAGPKLVTDPDKVYSCPHCTHDF